MVEYYQKWYIIVNDFNPSYNDDCFFLKQTLNNTYLTIENSYEFIESFYSSIFLEQTTNYVLKLISLAQ